MSKTLLTAALAVSALLATPAIMAQIVPNVAESGRAAPDGNYASIAALVLQAPLVVDATIRSAARIKGAEAAGVAPGFTRFYVEVDVVALIRAPGPQPARMGYVIDVPLDARGRVPQLKRRRVIAFARPVAGRSGQLQLLTTDSQRDWTADLDRLVREIGEAAVAADAPPEITGVGNAFHVPGSLPGEGETQIFLRTRSGAPVSLSILRRPGEQRRWAVALGEIVDDAAGPPRRDTLLWYRLACGLPRALPEASTASEEPARAEVAREDYAFVLQALGSCGAG